MKYWVLGLILVSVLPLINLFTPGIMDAHDAPDHVARIANFYMSLSEGNIIPRWAAHLNWGYGHPILMFLYPLPSYMASLFHALGLTFVDSVKVVFAVSYVASIIAFFYWAKLQWNVSAACVGAILYGFAPYRFVDMYVRGAIGEHMAFVFAPIIFLGLLKIARSASSWSGLILAFGTAGLLLSHNAVSLMVVPLALLYGTYLLIYEVKNKKAYIFYTMFYGMLGTAISAFFWVPAFFEGKYTLRDIVTKGEFTNRFVPLSKFFYSSWNYGISHEFSKELGVAQWIIAAIGIFNAPFVVLLLSISLLMQTSVAGWIWDTVTILQKFQFPWRFLTVSVLLSAALGSIVTYKMPKKHYIFCALALLAVITTIPMWKAKSYIVRPESYYTGIYDSTTDTGESSPIWSVRFMEHRPAMAMAIIEGDATISNGTRLSTVHLYTVTVKTKTRIVENTLYFPGWRVWVDGKEVPIEFQDPNHRGLITFWIDQGSHDIRIVFGETKLRMFANVTSIIGLFLAIIIVTIRVCCRWQLRFSMKKKTLKRALRR